MAVVTNHNHFDREEYKTLRRLGAKDGILVLPGVEIGLKDGGGGIHTLIVFNPEGWVSVTGHFKVHHLRPLQSAPLGNG